MEKTKGNEKIIGNKELYNFKTFKITQSTSQKYFTDSHTTHVLKSFCYKCKSCKKFNKQDDLGSSSTCQIVGVVQRPNR